MNLGNSSFRKNNDLGEVFDQRYKANHGNNERVQKEIHDFNKRMFNIHDRDDYRKEMLKSNSVSGQVNALNERMNCMNPRMGNVNRININSSRRNNFR